MTSGTGVHFFAFALTTIAACRPGTDQADFDQASGKPKVEIYL